MLLLEPFFTIFAADFPSKANPKLSEIYRQTIADLGFFDVRTALLASQSVLGGPTYFRSDFAVVADSFSVNYTQNILSQFGSDYELVTESVMNHLRRENFVPEDEKNSYLSLISEPKLRCNFTLPPPSPTLHVPTVLYGQVTTEFDSY